MSYTLIGRNEVTSIIPRQPDSEADTIIVARGRRWRLAYWADGGLTAYCYGAA